jgi:hypothetical protein
MRIVTDRHRPEFEDAHQTAFGETWPEFMYHDAVSIAHHGRAVRLFSDFDLLLVDGGDVLATAWAVPMSWDGSPADLPDGYDGALVRALDGHDSGAAPSTLCVMYAKVAAPHAAKGLAARVLTGMRDAALAAGLSHVVVPVRPTLKHLYPLQSMDEYSRWRREDGTSIDPWIRTHERMGAEIVGVARRSMVISGTVAEWESWMGLPLPASGEYVIDGALSPVRVDRDRDVAAYVEDNLWMQHL